MPHQCQGRLAGDPADHDVVRFSEHEARDFAKQTVKQCQIVIKTTTTSDMPEEAHCRTTQDSAENTPRPCMAEPGLAWHGPVEMASAAGASTNPS